MVKRGKRWVEMRSSGTIEPLKPGETWRGRLLKLIDEWESRNLEAIRKSRGASWWRS